MSTDVQTSLEWLVIFSYKPVNAKVTVDQCKHVVMEPWYRRRTRWKLKKNNINKILLFYFLLWTFVEYVKLSFKDTVAQILLFFPLVFFFIPLLSFLLCAVCGSVLSWSTHQYRVFAEHPLRTWGPGVIKTALAPFEPLTATKQTLLKISSVAWTWQVPSGVNGLFSVPLVFSISSLVCLGVFCVMEM